MGGLDVMLVESQTMMSGINPVWRFLACTIVSIIYKAVHTHSTFVLTKTKLPFVAEPHTEHHSCHTIGILMNRCNILAAFDAPSWLK